MHIEVLRYEATTSRRVLAFVDVRIGPFRFNGMNLNRDGSLVTGQLKWKKDFQPFYKASVDINDAALLERIRMTVLEYAARLPVDVRQKPPRLTAEQVKEQEARQKAEGAKIRAARKDEVAERQRWFNNLTPEERANVKAQHRALKQAK